MIQIINTQRGRATDTFVVEVDGSIDEHTDRDLAVAAGYNASHFGFNVVRHDDVNRATVQLHKD